MRKGVVKYGSALLVMFAMTLITLGLTYAQEEKTGKEGKPVKIVIQKKKTVKTSYAPVTITESFEDMMARMKAAKPEVMKRHMDLLDERYDLSNRTVKGITMSRGKPVQEGVRVKLQKDTTWEKLSAMNPEEIREKDLFPNGFMPLPHPNHAEGG